MEGAGRARRWAGVAGQVGKGEKERSSSYGILEAQPTYSSKAGPPIMHECDLLNIITGIWWKVRAWVLAEKDDISNLGHWINLSK